MTVHTAEMDRLIHIANTSLEREAIYRLRFDSIALEQGEQDRAGYQHHLVRDDRDEDAAHLYVGQGGQVLAAVRIHIGGDPPNAHFPLGDFADGDRSRFAYVSRLVVERSLRGGVITPVLFRAIYRYSVESGVRFGFTWCASALARWYERVGFREFAPRFLDPTVGELVPLVFVTDDVSYLRSIRSSLTSLAVAFHEEIAD